ncbi:MAG TPA: SMC family ATPase [Edaphocola sp.]|nr:SMC family ATPase [Edaphocola sp.]
MIPKKLIIEGLYSYQERQEIDFEQLMAAGLFGIFGATGSGKSSILEAITYVLYGKTERMNTELKYNMMNLKSNQMYLEFDFLNYQNKLFRAVRINKRNSKRFEDINKSNSDFYEFKDGAWLPINNLSIEDIIGMNYENFKRTIIIPQGQFKEFLELGPKDRTIMLKEIFDLQRFDLQSKTRELVVENKSKLDVLDGQLIAFEVVTDEALIQKELEYNKENDFFLKFSKEHDLLDKQYQDLKLLKKDAEGLKAEEERLKDLEKSKSGFKEKEERLSLFEKVTNLFAILINSYNRNKNEIITKQRDLDISERKVKEIDENLNLKKETIRRLEPDFKSLEQKKTQVKELDNIITIIDHLHEIEKEQKRKQNGQNIIQQEEENLEKLLNKIKESEQEINVLKAKLLNPELLLTIESWFKDKQNKEKSIIQIEQRIKLAKIELNGLVAFLLKEGINLEHFEDGYKAFIQEFEQSMIKLEAQKRDLELQQKLAEYSNELTDGKPCPLCGSAHHPNINHAIDVSQEFKNITDCLLVIKAQEKIWQENNILFNTKKEQKLKLEKDIANHKTELNELKFNYEQHLNAFQWAEFSKTDYSLFEQQKNENWETGKQLNEIEKLFTNLRKEIDDKRKLVSKCKDGLQEIKDKVNKRQSSIEILTGQIKLLSVETYEKRLPEEIKTELEALKISISNIEQQYKILTEECNSLERDYAKANSSRDIFKSQLKQLIEEQESVQKEIEEKLELIDLDDQSQIEDVLAWNIDTQQLRQEIQDFNIQLINSKENINKYHGILKDKNFSDALFVATAKQWEESEVQLQKANEKKINSSNEFLQLKKRLDEKKEILIKHAVVQKRAENLRIIELLFNGHGFVNYISSMYLTQLCNHANLRFHKMTNNQLSLQINDKNEFEIIDFLNEGRTRSVRTLSGGQSFQVSLSLALALAESVQAKSKTEQNFFFIDEGFGTQDGASVNTVFETLLNLNKENKIVGIISHVEELKERIPMALYISQDANEGSKISPSF